ncbi:MAG: FAD-dependent monooxygenase, partial [Burkholderiaceae bacterium]|nr:FAD-dependent monooxygenase [Burkholderiaceae bacterium]
MNIVCIGGGPAGLYFGLLMKKQNPAHQITVIERNRPYDTFGWGVVFSDQTLGNLALADEPSARAIQAAFNHWDDIDTYFKGEKVSSGGHGFCGIGRKHLLNILQQRCEELGVTLVFETEVEDDQALAARYQADLVIASDGLNSRIRSRYADSYQPQIEARRCRFVWLGTRKKFDAFTFAFKQTEHGWFQAHIYQYDADTSTFIVETPESVWRAAGLEQMTAEQSIAFCEQLFADVLDGHSLMSNAAHLRGSAMWITFPRIVCQRWVHWQEIANTKVPVVLMGDAAHTAHYSIGSGTKLALEDAIELARCFATDADSAAALENYQRVRAVEVIKLQSAARNSMEWFENVERYTALDAPQFAYSMLTRSQRLSHENLRLRDAAYVADYERWFAARAALQAGLPVNAQASQAAPVPPMFTPLKVRELVLKNRIVVSPMAQYSAVDGVVGIFGVADEKGRIALVFPNPAPVGEDVDTLSGVALTDQ